MANEVHADHVGSLLRPSEVLEARRALAEGRISETALREVEDEAILLALDLQRQVGIEIFSDGEYRRGGWSGDFAEAVDGFVATSPPIDLGWHGPEAVGAQRRAPARHVVGEKLRQRRRLTAHEESFLRVHASGPFKITLPAASYIIARGYKPGVTDKAYLSRADLASDVVAIIRAEIKALIDEGVTYIQLDDPHYSDYVEEDKRRQYRAIGIDPDRALREDVEADNASLEGLDRSRVTLAMHICRGNSRSGWHVTGAYDPIAEQVFPGIAVDRWLLEYDTERAGGFEPLRFMPRDKTVVLGLVSSKERELESQDELRRRIEDASKYVPLQNLALSPQCGFASVSEGNLLSWDDQRRKLELVVATARKVWG